MKKQQERQRLRSHPLPKPIRWSAVTGCGSSPGASSDSIRGECGGSEIEGRVARSGCRCRASCASAYGCGDAGARSTSGRRREPGAGSQNKRESRLASFCQQERDRRVGQPRTGRAGLAQPQRALAIEPWRAHRTLHGPRTELAGTSERRNQRSAGGRRAVGYRCLDRRARGCDPAHDRWRALAARDFTGRSHGLDRDLGHRCAARDCYFRRSSPLRDRRRRPDLETTVARPFSHASSFPCLNFRDPLIFVCKKSAWLRSQGEGNITRRMPMKKKLPVATMLLSLAGALAIMLGAAVRPLRSAAADSARPVQAGRSAAVEQFAKRPDRPERHGLQLRPVAGARRPRIWPCPAAPSSSNSWTSPLR